MPGVIVAVAAGVLVAQATAPRYMTHAGRAVWGREERSALFDMLRIHGGTPLMGTEVKALDLRAGIALVLAGLTADGTTTIAEAWQIERGYDRFLEKIRALGGKILADEIS